MKIKPILGVATPLTIIAAVAGLAGVPSFSPAAAQADSGVADFYRARGGAPLWLAPTSGNAAQQLLTLLASSQADHLNPRRYNVGGLTRALNDARGNPGATQRAEMMLSEAFVAYARDQKHDPGVGIIYVDPELRPTPPSATELLSDAARARSLSDYVQNMSWMSPIYAKLRTAIASRVCLRSIKQLALIAIGNVINNR